MKPKTFTHDIGDFRLTFGALSYRKLGLLAQRHPDRIGLVEGHPDHLGGYQDERGEWCDAGAKGATYVEGLHEKSPMAYALFFCDMMKFALRRIDRSQGDDLVPVQKSKHVDDLIDDLSPSEAMDIINRISTLLVPDDAADDDTAGNGQQPRVVSG